MQNTPQNNRHIALNSSGGIALGAYMAGIFFELIKEARKENSRLTIDIITGASAGAMTGAIAAYYLLNRKSIQQEEYENKNLFYQAWVEESDLENIDSIRAIEDYFKEFQNLFFSKNESLLSGKAIKEIGNIIADSSSLEVDRPLALIMTATNLQGLLLQDQNHLDVKAISSAETRRFLFHKNIKSQPEKLKKMWEKVIVSSRISGAFPVAFPPIEDASSAESYNFRYLSEDYFKDKDSKSKDREFNPNLPMYKNSTLEFSYTDGGILDNLPILKAVELEAQIHSHDQNDNSDFYQFSQEFQNNLKGERQERLYVYISPNSIENLDSKKRLKKTEFKLWDLIRSGLSLPKAEQEAIQLKRLMDLNKLAKSKTDILAKIHEIKNESNQQQLSEIEQQIEQALPYPKINLSQITPSILKDIEKLPKESRKKIQPLYHQFRTLLSINDDNWRSDELLSSDFLNAFGGFLDKRYRERDFILGRICGLTWLHKEFPGIETDSSIDSISADLDSKHLKFENPKFTDLKLSHRIRIFRIIVRGVRILTVQSELTGLWKILIPLNRVFLPLLFLSVEVGLSFIMILAQLLENLTEKLRR